jgi:hypothetical protein
MLRLPSHELAVRFIDRTQQFAEGRRLLYWPNSPESGPEHIEIATSKQSNSHDAFLSHEALRKADLS